VYLGIEIGGTKLQLGVGPGDGTLAGLWRGTVDAAAGPEGIRRQILRAVPELLARAGLGRPQVRGVGIGFGGPVDDATHTIIKSHQIAGWDGFPLAGWIADMLGCPAALGNDADVAGLAEALFGAGKGLSPIFYITVGSGIGGGLIINGEIYRGCGRGAAEIGHLDFTFHVSERKALGAPLEYFASGWGIANYAIEEIAQGDGKDSVLLRLVAGDPERITAWHIGQAAAEGDAFARYILQRSLAALSNAIVQVIKLLCPRRIVIGGGVSLLGEQLFFQPIRSTVGSQLAGQFPPFAGCCDIVPAALGEEVVVHGALALARRQFSELPKEGKAR
jgi:glucokinase